MAFLAVTGGFSWTLGWTAGEEPISLTSLHLPYPLIWASDIFLAEIPLHAGSTCCVWRRPREESGVRFHFSKHVQEELETRKIARALVDQVLQAPEQKVPEVEGITCFQSQVDIGGKQYLLRVMVNESVDLPIVVTVYRTNKIAKYWRKP